MGGVVRKKDEYETVVKMNGGRSSMAWCSS
jgi:hypothetical protein